MCDVISYCDWGCDKNKISNYKILIEKLKDKKNSDSIFTRTAVSGSEQDSLHKRTDKRERGRDNIIETYFSRIAASRIDVTN